MEAELLVHLDDYDSIHLMTDVPHYLASRTRVSSREFERDSFVVVAASFRGLINAPREGAAKHDFHDNMHVLRERVQQDPVAARAVVSQSWRCYSRLHPGIRSVLVRGSNCPRSMPHFCKPVAVLKAMGETSAPWLLFRDLDSYVAADKMDLALPEIVRGVPDDCHFVVTSSVGYDRFINSAFFVVRNSAVGRAILEHWWEASRDPSRYTADLDQVSLKHTMLTFINSTRGQPPYYANELETCHGKYASDARFPCRARFDDVLLRWGYRQKSDDELLRPFCRLPHMQLSSMTPAECHKTNAFLCHVGSKDWNEQTAARIRRGQPALCRQKSTGSMVHEAHEGGGGGGDRDAIASRFFESSSHMALPVRSNVATGTSRIGRAFQSLAGSQDSPRGLRQPPHRPHAKVAASLIRYGTKPFLVFRNYWNVTQCVSPCLHMRLPPIMHLLHTALARRAHPTCLSTSD